MAHLLSLLAHPYRMTNTLLCNVWVRVQSVCALRPRSSLLHLLPCASSHWTVPATGAPASAHPMNIIDLRQTTVRQLEPLLEEEARHWRDELHWDYRGALDLIKRFLEAHALCGSVAFENGSAAGYSFYVLEEQKGLIGGLYVSPRFSQADIGRRLLEEMLFSMRALPQLSRIQAP